MESTNEISLHQKLLLLPYAILPLTLAMVAYDLWSVSPFFKVHLPAEPDEWFLWPVLFNFPHIVGSTITFLDKEYLRHYRYKLVQAICLAVILAVILPILFGNAAAFIVMAFYTMYHVLMQQLGIAAMYAGGCGKKRFAVLKWSAVIAAGFLLLLIYGKLFFSPAQCILLQFGIRTLSVIACVAGIAIIVMLLRRNTPMRSVIYFTATILIIPTSLLMYEMGYPAFTIMIPRVVHDITAYLVYATHDHNRNRMQTKNLLYRLPLLKSISPGLLCVPLSMTISYLFVYYHGKFLIVTYAMFSLMFFHYYMEGVMWKKGALHRSYVSFKS